MGDLYIIHNGDCRSKCPAVYRNAAGLDLLLTALELILKRDYEKARSVLHQGLTFATGEMRIKSIQKIGLSWYFEGCVLKLQNKNKEAYLCFIEARKSFQEISDKGDEMSVLKQMAEIEKDSIRLMRLWKGITRW